jgi:hypothetical protein
MLESVAAAAQVESALCGFVNRESRLCRSTAGDGDTNGEEVSAVMHGGN